MSALGWLTSVPFQPTRAYCMYCKKNLHAHRLSLLKHTCTMKHQRAALLHDAEEKKKAAARKAHVEEKVEVEEVEEMEVQILFLTSCCSSQFFKIKIVFTVVTNNIE